LILRATALSLVILICFSCRSKNPVIALNTKQIPEKSYIYTIGAKNHPEALSCKLQRFSHPDSGIEVSVLGMIHMASPEFYDKVHHLALDHDKTLSEGVHGSPGLSAHHLLIQYISSYFSRINFYSRLVPQSHYLANTGNEVNADMSLKEFSNEGTFYTPFIQIISLPIIILGGEANNIALYMKYIISGAILNPKLQQNELTHNRKLLFSHMREMEDTNLPMLPGIIKSRNNKLLSILESLIAKNESKSFFIPWGAAHSPDIEKRLIAKGFVKSSPPEWILSIDFNSINQAESSQHYLPLIYYFYHDKNTFEYSMILGIFKGFKRNEVSHCSVLWNLLYSSSKSVDFQKINLLPKIFDRPVFFSYTSSYKKRKIKALLFFEFEWNK